MNNSIVLSADQKEGGKVVVGLKEFDDIYQRFKRVFLLTNVLTMLMAVYVIARLLWPEKFEVEALKRLQTVGLCVMLGSAIFLSIAQWLCLRQTTRTSRRKVEEITFMDALTNVYNYLYIDRRLDEEIRIAQRFHTPLSLIYLDIDKFKQINDTKGHPAGNSVLAEGAGLLKSTARATDLVGRLGGDEFLVILPGTNRTEAETAAERIRQHFEGHLFTIDTHKVNAVRVSVGVATYPYDAHDKESLITASDKAMYRAKQAGGNRVCF